MRGIELKFEELAGDLARVRAEAVLRGLGVKVTQLLETRLISGSGESTG